MAPGIGESSGLNELEVGFLERVGADILRFDGPAQLAPETEI
jgi:hypothetical protein